MSVTQIAKLAEVDFVQYVCYKFCRQLTNRNTTGSAVAVAGSAEYDDRLTAEIEQDLFYNYLNRTYCRSCLVLSSICCQVKSAGSVDRANV